MHLTTALIWRVPASRSLHEAGGFVTRPDHLLEGPHLPPGASFLLINLSPSSARFLGVSSLAFEPNIVAAKVEQGVASRLPARSGAVRDPSEMLRSPVPARLEVGSRAQIAGANFRKDASHYRTNNFGALAPAGEHQPPAAGFVDMKDFVPMSER